MSDLEGLNRRRAEPFLSDWIGFISPERIAAASQMLQQLVEDIIRLGPDPTEDAARKVVTRAAHGLNDLDDGWICTTEREDLCETLFQIIELAGFEADEDWIDRDW